MLVSIVIVPHQITNKIKNMLPIGSISIGPRLAMFTFQWLVVVMTFQSSPTDDIHDDTNQRVHRDVGSSSGAPPAAVGSACAVSLGDDCSFDLFRSPISAVESPSICMTGVNEKCVHFTSNIVAYV